MKVLKFLWVLLLFSACQVHDDLELSNVKNELSASHGVTTVSLDIAVERANSLLEQLDGGKSTRSISRSIKSIEYINTKPLSRGGGVCDTLLYLINYNDNKGFALMGADNRLHSVYAISDEGQLNVADTVFNRAKDIFRTD